MIRAFRDTWELGIHSYLGYLRDRLWLAKELLHESGSCFVQISDENVHFVRNLMDEVFGVDNFLGIIAFTKTTGFSGTTLSSVADYLVWYTRSKEKTKYHQLFRPKEPRDEGASKYRPVSSFGSLAKGRFKPERLATVDQLTSQGASGEALEDFEYQGKPWRSASIGKQLWTG